MLIAPRYCGMTGVGIYYNTIGLTQEYLASAAILSGVILCQIPRNWLTGRLATIGTYSYSIYLWHMAAIYWVTPHLRESTSWEVRATIYLGGAFAMGIGMAQLWELPTIKIRDRFFPSLVTDNAAPAAEAVRPARKSPALNKTAAARSKLGTEQAQSSA